MISAAPSLISEADVILPPPTASNPIPTLQAALRLDNQEQLIQMLQSNPISGSEGGVDFRQLLVFGTDSLRTLLLRQVLNDPHTRAFKTNKKKNWESCQNFQFPKALQASIVGTRLLHATAGLKTSTATTQEGAEVSLREDHDDREHVDVINYFVRPWDLSQTRLVCDRIRMWKKKAHHRIIYFPQTTALVQRALSDAGLVSAPNVTVTKLQLDLFPIEPDLISLEYGEALKEEVEGTPSTLISAISRSMMKLQDVVGKIPRIQSLGNLSEESLRKFMNQSVDEYLAGSQPDSGENGPVSNADVPAMILLDRKVDMVTPMLSPLTYEGLLDEIIGVDMGFIQVNVNTINPEDEQNNGEAKKQGEEVVVLGVNSSDLLYAEVRDQHVEKFGSFLQTQAMALKESHANFTNKEAKKDLAEIHQFVKQIPMFTQNLRSLTNHIHLAEVIKQMTEEPTFREQWQTERSMLEGETCYDMLEDLIAAQYPPFKVLRLLCLQSLCAGGIKSNRYDVFRTQIVQAYGYEFLFLLQDLEKVGLIRRRDTIWVDTSSSFGTLRKSLVLINAEVDTVDPDDVSYVSSGYAPLSARLVQAAVLGWSGKEDIVRELQGRLIDITQYNPPEDLATSMKRTAIGSLGSLATKRRGQSPSKKPTLIVFYLGGVSFMEIAALRFLSKRPSFQYHIVIITTKVLNGSTLMKTLG